MKRGLEFGIFHVGVSVSFLDDAVINDQGDVIGCTVCNEFNPDACDLELVTVGVIRADVAQDDDDDDK